MHKFGTFPLHLFLQKQLTSLLEAPPSTLLFEGPKGVGKSALAKLFAYELLSGADLHKLESGNHPDLRELYPEGKAEMHPIEAIKNLIKEAYIPPYETSRRVFIIYDAEKMLLSSSNALLKTLEEPPSYSYFILISSQPETLLSTVISRAFRISFFPPGEEEIKNYLIAYFQKTEDEAIEIARLSEGNLSRAKRLANDQNSSFFSTIAKIGLAAISQDYPLFFHLIKEIETSTNSSEIQEILTTIYAYFRDLALLKEKGDPSLLFFKGEEKTLRQSLSYPLSDLIEVKKRLEKVQEGLLYHIPLRHCLSYLMI
jgi:DNA polymerase-3 subunit delta'